MPKYFLVRNVQKTIYSCPLRNGVILSMEEPDQQINEDLFRLLINQLSEGVIITDPDGVILYVNQAAELIRNVRKEDIIGNNAIHCHAKSSAAKVERAIAYLQDNPDKTYHRMSYNFV